jgi:hypothetical protein
VITRDDEGRVTVRATRIEEPVVSDRFVVYSDGRDTLMRGVPDGVNRSFAVKYTRLSSAESSCRCKPLARFQFILSMSRSAILTSPHSVAGT